MTVTLRTLALLCSFHYCLYGQSPLLSPVLIKGHQIEALQGFPAATIAAYRYTTAQGWQQIPLQIDERATRTAAQLWNKSTEDDLGILLNVYTDPKTYNGPDPDGTFDADDELLVYLEHTGEQADLGSLPESLQCPPLELKVMHPLNFSETYFYLFLHDYQLHPEAMTDLVDYRLELLAGPEFLEVYDTKSNNPEDSWVQTDVYRWHFTDDWINDQWHYRSGPAPEQDLIDLARLQLGPGICNRHIGTFSEGAGTHICSTDGPLRAIRSVMGANSGNLLQRTYFFYPSWVEIQTDWRVHPVRGLMETIDWNSALSGYTYYNAQHPGGLPIDGFPDKDFNDKFSEWQLISGPEASIWIQTDIQADFSIDTIYQYYLDEQQAHTEQCIGDSTAMGQCGFFIQQQIPNTDPRNEPVAHLQYRQRIHFLPPYTSPETAMELQQWQKDTFLIAAHGDLSCAREKLFYQVLPNPVHDRLLRVNFSSDSQVRLSLFDQGGRRHLERYLRQSAWIQLPAQLPTGLYFLHIENKHFHRVERIFILN